MESYLFKPVQIVQVTPVDDFSLGSFVRIGDVPAAEQFPVVFGRLYRSNDRQCSHRDCHVAPLRCSDQETDGLAMMENRNGVER
jgi:hypothetical protein